VSAPAAHHVRDGLVNSALADLDLFDTGGTFGPGSEMRERLRSVVEDQAAIAMAAMAGQDVSIAQAALQARAEGLAAAGAIITADHIRQAMWRVLLTAARVACTAAL
jgi:hypothetical protein